MKILILGAGKMGSFFCDILSFNHDVAVYDRDPQRLRFLYNCRRFASLDEIDDFDPDMVLNAATVRYTLDAFRQVLPHIRPDALLADIASVKEGLPAFYAGAAHPYVSTHPMFGPTFASLSNLADENAIIITEGNPEGIAFFDDLYTSLGLHIERYTFDGHDRVIAYSLSVPFASSLVFGSAMEPQPAPGTTFKRHLAIARGLMSEDDYLLSEILFNPRSAAQLARISAALDDLRRIIERRDTAAMTAFLHRVRQNLRPATPTKMQ